MKESYSKISSIPSGHASKILIPGCLVLEGGAFRGLYTQGYLDAMMLNEINLTCVIGVSAGALAGVNYVSGNIGRSARINLSYRHDSRYIGLRALLHSRSIVDVGFLTENRGITEPLDIERFNDPERRYVAVATNCITGKPSYFEKGTCSDIMLAARASGTIQYISPMVTIDGIPHLDGGCSCQIPYHWALEQGYKKIIVIRTQDRSFRADESINPARRSRYRSFPALTKAIEESHHRYNLMCDELEQLQSEGRLFLVNPSQPVRIKQIENDLEKLGELYFSGYQDCINQLDALKEYLL